MLRVVGCFLEYNGKFVLLLRHSHKPDGNTWGLPAGKVKPNETDEQAVQRELREETGYQAQPSELQYLRQDIFQFSHGPVTFVVYKVVLARPHQVIVEKKAHQTYRWVTPQEAYVLPNLIYGLHKVFDLTGYK